jgi:lauroyl/myristoyl acyltransferase
LTAPWSDPTGTARALLGRLGPGEAVLMFPDAELHPAAQLTQTVTIGRYDLCLPRGAAWLAETRQCTIVPVYIRPHDDSAHAVVFGPAIPPASPNDAAARVNASVQYLMDQTVMVDPSPWEGWLREGLRGLLSVQAE